MLRRINGVYKDIQGLCQAQVQVVVDFVFMFVHLAFLVRGMISSQSSHIHGGTTSKNLNEIGTRPK